MIKFKLWSLKLEYHYSIGKAWKNISYAASSSHLLIYCCDTWAPSLVLSHLLCVRIWLFFDHCVYPQIQTPDTMTTHLSAIYRRERNEGEWDRGDRSWTQRSKEHQERYYEKMWVEKMKKYFRYGNSMT